MSPKRKTIFFCSADGVARREYSRKLKKVLSMSFNTDMVGTNSSILLSLHAER